jgi:metal-sulfur cluster biosynthetic enzyme
MVRDLQVSPAGAVSFTFALTVINCPMRDRMGTWVDCAISAALAEKLSQPQGATER